MSILPHLIFFLGILRVQSSPPLPLFSTIITLQSSASYLLLRHHFRLFIAFPPLLCHLFLSLPPVSLSLSIPRSSLRCPCSLRPHISLCPFSVSALLTLRHSLISLPPPPPSPRANIPLIASPSLPSCLILLPFLMLRCPPPVISSSSFLYCVSRPCHFLSSTS